MGGSDWSLALPCVLRWSGVNLVWGCEVTIWVVSLNKTKTQFVPSHSSDYSHRWTKRVLSILIIYFGFVMVLIESEGGGERIKIVIVELIQSLHSNPIISNRCRGITGTVLRYCRMFRGLGVLNSECKGMNSSLTTSKKNIDIIYFYLFFMTRMDNVSITCCIL